MKVLSIVWYKVLPPEYGGQKGIALFNKYLSQQQPLVCVCSANNEPETGLPYKVLPVLPVGKSQFTSFSCIKKIKGIAKEEKATHIIVEHPYHGLAGSRASRSTGAKLIIHSHNIESQRFREMGKAGWRLLYAYEKWVHRRADFNLFKTETDLTYAITHFGIDPGKCMIMPYGIEKPVLTNKPEARTLIATRHGIAPSEKIILFAGTLDYTPNAKAVERIYQEIAPRLAANKTAVKVIVCGRNRFAAFQYLKKLSHPLVIDAGEVADIQPYFSAADAFINPVQGGGGVQTKNIDALNYGLNVVCFENALAGIDRSLCAGKIFAVPQNDWPAFIENIDKAIATGPVEVPGSFFEYYSFATHTEKLVERLNSLS